MEERELPVDRAMKFTDKLLITALVMAFTTPAAPQNLLGMWLWGASMAAGVLMWSLIWEFTSHLADLTAFNEWVERWVREDTMAVLDWTSVKLYGEKLSE